MKSSRCTLTINGKSIICGRGDTLLDAALGGRIVLPHDCCSGQCETCRVRVVAGDIDDQGTADGKTVLGCLATVEGDAEVAFDPVPVVKDYAARLESIRPLSHTIVEVRLRTRKLVPWLPGQYVRVTFQGFPARDYSPTFPFELDHDENVITLHVRRYPGGRVSEALGKAIRPGHKVRINGPYGNAFLRREPEPLYLISTGTGFAPIWSIAVASVLGQPTRPILVIASARFRKYLYMNRGLEWLEQRGIPIILTAADGDGHSVRRERPSTLLDPISGRGVVYAAGAPSEVERIRLLAARSGVSFYADPFYAAEEKEPLFKRLKNPFRRITLEPVGEGHHA